MQLVKKLVIPPRIKLEKLYDIYNRREYVHPDPLEFLYDYNKIADIEIVGLIASSLAYGRVFQILKSVNTVLETMQQVPYDYIMSNDKSNFENDFAGFKHRFTTDTELVALLLGIKQVLNDFGSLGNCFEDSLKQNQSNNDIICSLSSFTKRLLAFNEEANNSLIPLPEKGSACKRLNLYLRWMIREDEVDLGCWNMVSPDKLIIPLDTHMHNICQKLGLTSRKQADFKTAIEITNEFRRISPADPVKYDFCLTRLGIRDDTDLGSFIKECELHEAEF